MSQRPIQFWFRGQLTQVSDVSPQRTVLQWLREDLHATGSKEGCGEGDCGACTVVVGSRDDAACGGVRLEAVNSCIQLLPTLDGKALFTVEDLAKGEALHPVQQAMVDCHGSQCGFCTPGFVMSMWADYERRDAPPTRDEVTDCLSGNLCRCTGYRPIIDAAQAAWQAPVVKLDRAPMRAALDTLAAVTTLDYSFAGQRFIAPRSIEALALHCEAMPDARLLAGSTDIGLWVTKQLRQLGDIIYLGAVDELKRITQLEDCIEIGAGVSLTDAFAALCNDEPNWSELARRFASVPVRNAGTLGGNVANGSPIGDSMPLLIALGASIVLMHARDGALHSRELPLESFYTGYRKNQLAADELLAWIKVPLPQAKEKLRVYKVSKRQDDDISAVCLALNLQVQDGLITQARVGAGGVAATPARAFQTEAALEGQPWARASLAQAATVLAREFAPISDMRASADYRRDLLAQLPLRYWEEIEGDEPVRLEDLS
jgi:xanthine dehydrogenase small subunit